MVFYTKTGINNYLYIISKSNNNISCKNAHFGFSNFFEILIFLEKYFIVGKLLKPGEEPSKYEEENDKKE